MSGTWTSLESHKSSRISWPNALQHGQPAGAITVLVDGRDPEVVAITITNAGVIPSDPCRTS
jgi:hypothetical protein